MELKMFTSLDTLPKGIEFNYAELKGEIDAMLLKYKGKEKTDSSNYQERKSARAALNALSKQLDDYRKSVKKRLLAVMESGTSDHPSFVDQMKDILGAIAMVVEEIDAGIKEYEENRRSSKREEIMKFLCDDVTHKFSQADAAFPNMSRDYAKSMWFKAWAAEQMDRRRIAWLNDGTSMIMISEEISNEVARCVKDASMLEGMFQPTDSELVRNAARKSMAEKFDLSVGLTSLEAGRKTEQEAREREAEAERKRNEEIAKRVVAQPSEEENKSEEKSPAAPILYSCVMRFVGTEEAFNNLKQYLEMNNDISYQVEKGMEAVSVNA